MPINNSINNYTTESHEISGDNIKETIIKNSLKIGAILGKVKNPGTNILKVLGNPEIFAGLEFKDKVKLYYEIDDINIKKDFIFELLKNSNVKREDIDNILVLFENIDLSDLPGILSLIKILDFYIKDNYNFTHIFLPTTEKLGILQGHMLLNVAEIYSKLSNPLDKNNFKNNYEFALSIFVNDISGRSNFFSITRYMMIDNSLFKFLLNSFGFNPTSINNIIPRFKSHRNAGRNINTLLENNVKMGEIIESVEICEIANSVRSDYFEAIMNSIRLKGQDLIYLRNIFLSINYETSDFRKNVENIVKQIETSLRGSQLQKKEEKKMILLKIIMKVIYNFHFHKLNSYFLKNPLHLYQKFKVETTT